MRALVVSAGPYFSVQDVYEGWVYGLQRNGVQVAEFNLHERLHFYTSAMIERDGDLRHAFNDETAARLATQGLYAAAYKLWPDVIFITSGLFVEPEAYKILRDRGHKVVLIDTESPYELGRLLAIAGDCDAVATNDPVVLPGLREVCRNSHYVPHGYNPERHCAGPVDPALAGDVGFVGTGYPSRTELLEAVDWSGIELRLGGNWDHIADDSPLGKALVHERHACMANSDAVRLYRSVKVGLNLYRREIHAHGHADGWAMGPREVELAAIGTFFLRDSRPESDGVLGMLPCGSRDPGELGEQLRYWLSHDAEREALANRARAAVADRTFTNTTAMFLRHI